MKILLITPGFLPTIGGAEIGAHEIYYRLAKKHEVLILTQAVREPGRQVPGYDMSRYRVKRYQDWGNLGRIPGRMLLRGSIPPFSLGATFASIQAIREFEPDVINVHYAIYTGLAAAWAQNVRHVPTVLSLVGRDSAPGPRVPKLWPWYAGKIASRVRHTIFISEFCRKHFNPDLPATVIPYGVDTHFLMPTPPDLELRRRLNLPEDVPVILSLQRLAPIKRVGYQIKAARLLVDTGFMNFILLIGGNGQERKSLEMQSEQLGIKPHVRFLGYIPEPELPRYFSLADVFIQTSAYETFGIVLAQAMSAGLPIAAMANTAISEVVTHGSCGLLSQEGDLQAFAGNIRRLLENTALRKEMGANARARARDCYDWDQIASHYESVLELACH